MRSSASIWYGLLMQLRAVMAPPTCAHMYGTAAIVPTPLTMRLKAIWNCTAIAPPALMPERVSVEALMFSDGRSPKLRKAKGVSDEEEEEEATFEDDDGEGPPLAPEVFRDGGAAAPSDKERGCCFSEGTLFTAMARANEGDGSGERPPQRPTRTKRPAMTRERAIWSDVYFVTKR